MEARIARLTSDVEHLHTRLADLKIDLARLSDKVDALKERIRPCALKAPDSPRRDPLELPLRLIYLFVLGMVLAAMSHGFGWI